MKRSLTILSLLAFTALQAGAVPKFPGNDSADDDGSDSRESSAAKAADKPAPPAKLRWNNGESLPGEIAEASATELTWKTALFEDPLVLRWPAICRIDRPVAAVPSPDACGVTLRDGSFLEGELVSISEDAVSIHSTRHGDVKLKRSEVLSIRRVHPHGSLLATGPAGDVGWTLTEAKKQEYASSPLKSAVPVLIGGRGGSLFMPYWNSSALLKVALPNRVDVEFRVRSLKRPDFQLTFLEGAQSKLSIASWDDELVLTAKTQFKSIRKIGDAERTIGLRVCWDRLEKKCAVYSSAGELLADWQVPEVSKNPVGGLLLDAKGRDLTLEFLRVQSWDGNPPSQLDPAQPRIETSDGKILEGTISTGTADGFQFQQRGQGVAEIIPFDQIDAVIFSADAPKPAEPDATLSFADGTFVQGKILAIREGSASLQTSFSEAPLNSRLDALRQLHLRAPTPEAATSEPALAMLDKMVFPELSLHGRFATAGDNRLRWLPVGAVKPVLPVASKIAELVRYFPLDGEIPGVPGLFYTRDGDVLPGSLRSLDRSGVELESSVVELTKIPAANLGAVQFGVTAQKQLKGFTDPGWRIVLGKEGQVKRTKDTLGLEPGAAFGHPAGMASGEINFKLPYSGFAASRFRLFCSGTDPAKSFNIIIANTGGQVTLGTEGSDGGFDNEVQMPVPSSKPVTMRLVTDGERLKIFVNGALQMTAQIPQAARAGSGLIVEPTSIWGNQPQRIELADFWAPVVPGSTWLPDVSEESKLQARTVPRFRKEDLPRQVIIAANGDVLRGEIEAMTENHFGFRSGLENLRIPRDRVKAAIWLQKPDEATGAPAPRLDPVMQRLQQKVSSQFWYSETELRNILQVLENDAPELKFKGPEKFSRRLEMRFPGKTFLDVLNELCDTCELHYRIDGNTVILEEGARVEAKLIRQAYWLKPAAFPAKPTVRETLAAKGIAFPAGADVQWQPATGQLSMINTAENQHAVAKLLESDFGGVLIPTHWLQLANGGRFGLIVDKFSDEFIDGHHPLYGHCKVPTAQIASIRTSMPEPTAVVRSLQDWRLAYAPDPVVAESGGESSPTLGKQAATFKLPLLGGGEFDLSKEKGKVIVLDFWATWCGPCVQSLPGLIEAMSAFPSDRVKLIGVNQAEAGEQVKRFLKTRGWDLNVALDSGSVAQQYGVDGIPHTVIIGPDGKVAWVKTGYTPDGDKEAAAAVTKLLNPSAQDAPAKDPSS